MSQPDGPLNSVEISLEKLQASMDNEDWRTCLTAMNTLSTPYLHLVATLAYRHIDPRLPIAPSLIKVAQELSILLGFMSDQDRAGYALSVALYSLTHNFIRENPDE